MSTPFCKKCGCICDDDVDYCPGCISRFGESLLDSFVRLSTMTEEPRQQEMDCGIACNGVCRVCKKPVVKAIMLPQREVETINPELEHGGDIEVRPNSQGKYFAKVTGPDPEMKKFVLHAPTCHGYGNGRKTGWEEERARIIREQIGRL